MIKIAGFIAVIVSTTLVGMTLSENISKRHNQLRSVIRMIKECKIRLEYNLPTKDELLSYLFGKPEYTKFKADKLDLTKLTDNEKNRLVEFYNQLGNSDLQSQLLNIEIYINDFENQLSELDRTKDNHCRLLRTGGVLTGIFICLLLA